MKTAAEKRVGFLQHQKGFTLIEVVVCMAIMGIVFAGIVTAYIQASRKTEWTGYSLAAQALAQQQIEQVRAATWDTQSSPIVDQTADRNLTNIVGAKLDVPQAAGTSGVWATNYPSVTTLVISSNPVVYVKQVRVDTVWPWRNGTFFTNSIMTYRAPDQ